MKKIRIAVTMGDASGIGPEIAVKMFKHNNIGAMADVFVIGDLFPLLGAQRNISRNTAIRPIPASKFSVQKHGGNKDIKLSKDRNIINLLDMNILGPEDYCPGEMSPKAAKAAYLYVRKAIELAKSGMIDAIVTAPINKEAFHSAGINYPGHTEILGKFTGTKDFVMMLAGEKLKVTLVTVHRSIKSVPGLLSAEKILKTISVTHKSLKQDFGIKSPRIAVLGLNPHSGEGGKFGNEEQKIIAPAIKKAVKKGIDARGPFPADTIFSRIVEKNDFDAAVCMYHDQGLIPVKLLYFDTGVNITLGLPFVRTSPDHGTAYDIAGTGRASELSILSALKAAIQIAKNRKKIR